MTIGELPEKDMAVPTGYQIHQHTPSTWTASKLEAGLRYSLLASNGEAKLFRRPYRAVAYCREHARKKLSYREFL
jgi:hypothetical protein